MAKLVLNMSVSRITLKEQLRICIETSQLKILPFQKNYLDTNQQHQD